MAFYRVPTEFTLESLCVPTTVHGAHNACTALSRHPHCVDDVLKTHCRDFPAFPKFWPGAC